MWCRLLGGPVAPFDAASLFLFVGGSLILFMWPENYGEQQGNPEKGTAHMSSMRKIFSLARPSAPALPPAPSRFLLSLSPSIWLSSFPRS